jgi:prolyl-tRNA editing enzyme YbaK/EbsC (Cys-tRNA(Pro) deacylase)
LEETKRLEVGKITPIGFIAAALTYLDLNEMKAVDTLVGKAGDQGDNPEDPAIPEQIN